MNNNWTKAISKINKARYMIPSGWDTKEQVAESLQCAPTRVAELLKPGLASGDVERQEFLTWDADRNHTARVACYRVIENPAAKDKPKSVSRPSPVSKLDRIKAAIKKWPGASNYSVARHLSNTTAAEVAAARSQLKS